jgi:UDP-2-acetamido-3-amino-2,3-dideoxy-glucuronate N-acetyltransferase
MIHHTCEIESPELLGESVQVWQYSHVRFGASVGAGSVIGRNVYVGPNVVIGKNCKIQNGAFIYDPANLADGVFIGPQVILTNDKNPRAIMPQGHLKKSNDWNPVGVTIDYGASIGAGAVCVAPLHIGKWASVAAGSVVTKNVPNYALVAGCPAIQIGWVGEDGRRLRETSTGFVSDTLSTSYSINGGILEVNH